MTMPLPLLFLIGLSVAGLAVAAWVYVQELSRRQAVERSLASGDSPEARALRRIAPAGPRQGLVDRLLKRAPTVWASGATIQSRLIRAGYDSETAPLWYSLVRSASVVVLPVAAVLVFSQSSFMLLVTGVGAAVLLGFFLPDWFVLRKGSARQEQIRKSLPDALDLLVVCVEAGMSLDAAILRVARDLMIVHPALAGELLLVNRKTNAGVTREDALRGLWDRTGVEEIRSVVSSLVRSDRWGTSNSRVLSVASESLRDKRRNSIEKRAATAPLKMIVPIALFILPALFVVVVGPAFLTIAGGFGD